MYLRTIGANQNNVRIRGDKQAVIVGGVQMPNGMFYIVGGWYNGYPIERSAKASGTETQGGPLFLHVGYDGKRDNQYFYVFGFRGYINWCARVNREGACWG